MATSREYFEKSIHLEYGFELTYSGEGQNVVVPIKVAYDFDGGSKYLRAYVPETTNAVAVIAALGSSLDAIWKEAGNVLVQSGLAGTNELVDGSALTFSGRLLVYTPNDLTDEMHASAKVLAAGQGLNLLIRDGHYTKKRASYEKPLAFISHDSRDKEPFVKDLAMKLTTMMCPVWYDEYRLNPGDSLRESIETGLKNCPKCIVVLSKNFFSNNGWTRREFDSIYTREVIEEKRVMVPVWLDVTKEEVFSYSPILADTVGVKADLGVEEVARKLFNVLTKTI